MAREVLLLEIEDEVHDEGGSLIRPCRALFTDGSVLEFPPGVRFEPENIGEDGSVPALRFVPRRDGSGRYVQPSFLIRKYSTIESVRQAIRRIRDGV